MKNKVIATYERESTLWKNANFFYVLQDWVKMVCSIYDYSEEIDFCVKNGVKWTDMNGNDVTEQEIERRYGKPFHVELYNKRGNNSRGYEFKTREEANKFVQSVLNDKVFCGFKRVS